MITDNTDRSPANTDREVVQNERELVYRRRPPRPWPTPGYLVAAAVLGLAAVAWAAGKHVKSLS